MRLFEKLSCRHSELVSESYELMILSMYQNLKQVQVDVKQAF